MFKDKNKSVGLLGTILFHLAIILICFFSSIGYTSVEEQLGIPIQFIPFQEFDINSEDEKLIDDSDLVVSEAIDSETKIQDIIVENEETIKIPSLEDSVLVTEKNLDDLKTATISSELQNALSTLNQMNTSQSPDSLVSPNSLVLSTNTNNTIIGESKDGYALSENRFAVSKVKPNYKCEELGKVVVRVWVNREGRTIKAEPGIRGTTESASCLFEEAKHAALQTTWTPYFDAPEIQIGQITYNFYKY
ncbi:MAG: hypothetical protein CMD26_03040 [Flavobacteriales bacterium]|nr:hypothetical protein [Flavobacteriales bacterium]|tara:strand:- start:168 stop:911 length:744 start_codon:yes stop_codon:yes gene_type:complete